MLSTNYVACINSSRQFMLKLGKEFSVITQKTGIQKTELSGQKELKVKRKITSEKAIDYGGEVKDLKNFNNVVPLTFSNKDALQRGRTKVT